ncbi:hypothetical protein INT43_000487 [Umbelopsis isabellina]|uniref:N-acetylglucosamine-6-phosphate deacetylase n=1 Tax=Mortierella isabellina TaxID=91625 RepID=A0A8H7Q281_MORIS|nr:hypothetical protein INT43_000487 [Umbelopsis isabellina]
MAVRPQTDTEGKIVKIINARVLLNHKLTENSYLWFKDSKIIDPQELFFQDHKEPDMVIDAENAIVAPGYLDIQINGAFGIDFADENLPVEDIARNKDVVAKGLLQFGCTSFCPTLVSSAPQVYHKVLPHLRKRLGSVENGAEILGVHIEGPFLNPEKKGAHNEEVLQCAERGMESFDDTYGPALKRDDSIAILTVAPEVKGVLECIPTLAKRGICISMGHSTASVTEAELGVRAGATCITHLFNAMPAFHHRDAGICGLLGSTTLPIPKSQKQHPIPSQSSPSPTNPDPRPFYGLICDGIHVHPNSVRIAYHSHPKGLVLVTDALSSMGLPPGCYHLGDYEVEVNAQNVAYVKGTKTLAGSNITIDRCVQNFRKFTKCSTVEAIEAATLHPAQVLGIEKTKGTLNAGSDADILFLNDDLEIQRVFVRGEEVDLKVN